MISFKEPLFPLMLFFKKENDLYDLETNLTIQIYKSNYTFWFKMFTQTFSVTSSAAWNLGL